MTTQSILDSGQLTGQETAEELEEAKAFAQWQIDGFRNSHWGSVADEAIARLTTLIDRIDAAQIRHHGLDGMTPVQP